MAGHQFTQFSEPTTFLKRVRGFLMEREELHTLHLGILERLMSGESWERDPTAPPLLMSVEAGGRVVGFAMRTPPHKLLISDLVPSAAASLARTLQPVYTDLPAVLGDRGAATAFADAWVGLVGGDRTLAMENAIHRLDILEWTGSTEGAPRVAGPSDLGLLVDWFQAFEAEALATVTSSRERIAAKAAAGDLILWTAHGEPVSIAGVAARTPNSGRVGPVYTPPASRGRGFGTAATAAVTRTLLEEGKSFCVLYTDLANPTSNKIYGSLGYRVVAEVVDIRLHQKQILPGQRDAPRD